MIMKLTRYIEIYDNNTDELSRTKCCMPQGLQLCAPTVAATGKGVERSLDKRINTYENSLRTEPIRIGSPISRFVEPSYLPIGVSNILDSSMSKSLETIWDNYEILNGGKNENPSK